MLGGISSLSKKPISAISGERTRGVPPTNVAANERTRSSRYGTIGVFASLFDKSGRILLVRQAYAAHRWTTPGGRVEDGESPLMALEREVLEEIGCEVQVAHLIGVYAKMTCVSTESKREQD